MRSQGGEWDRSAVAGRWRGGREKTGRDRESKGRRGEAWGERAGEGKAEAERAFGRRCVYARSPNRISPPQWQDTRLPCAAFLPLE